MVGRIVLITDAKYVDNDSVKASLAQTSKMLGQAGISVRCR